MNVFSSSDNFNHCLSRLVSMFGKRRERENSGGNREREREQWREERERVSSSPPHSVMSFDRRQKIWSVSQ